MTDTTTDRIVRDSRPHDWRDRRALHRRRARGRMRDGRHPLWWILGALLMVFAGATLWWMSGEPASRSLMFDTTDGDVKPLDGVQLSDPVRLHVRPPDGISGVRLFASDPDGGDLMLLHIAEAPSDLRLVPADLGAGRHVIVVLLELDEGRLEAVEASVSVIEEARSQAEDASEPDQPSPADPQPPASMVPTHRVNAGGDALSADPPWTADTADGASQFVALDGGSGNFSSVNTQIDLSDASVPDDTPHEIFLTERWGSTGIEGRMEWSFPVEPGPYTVRLYFAETWEQAYEPGARVFDVLLEGEVALSTYDIVEAAGAPNRAVVETLSVESDETLDVHLVSVAGNPAIKAIEVLGPPQSGSASSGTAVEDAPVAPATSEPGAATEGSPPTPVEDARDDPAMGDRPGPSTTGPRADVAAMDAHEGTLHVTEDGTVIEKIDIRGNVVIEANNVVVRDVRIRSSAPYPVRVMPGSEDVLLEHCEIDGLRSAKNNGGVMGRNVTVRHCDLHSHTDSAKVGTNSVWEHNWLHDNGAWGTDAHVDGLQSLGGRNIVVRGNFIDMPGVNAAIIFNTDAGPLRDVTIERNWLNGGNYTIYVREKSHGTPHGVRIVGNRFGREYRHGLFSLDGDVLVTGNVWDDTGEPLE